MKRFKCLFLFIATLYISFFFRVYALELIELEKSEPYIILSSDKLKVEPGDFLKFTINYGNLGSEPAKNIKISFNQPLDARSPLEFVSADPEPDNWLINEYGNIAEYLINNLETYEVTEEGEINIQTEVRQSVVTQTLTPSVKIYAPFRESGKRLISSNALILEVIGDANNNLENETIDYISPVNKIIDNDDFFNESTKGQETESRNNSQKIIIVVKYLFVFALLLIAFILGRISKKENKP